MFKLKTDLEMMTLQGRKYSIYNETLYILTCKNTRDTFILQFTMPSMILLLNHN